MNDPSVAPLPPLKPDNISPQRSTPLWKKRKVWFKNLSLKEIPRNVAWERSRRLKFLQEKKGDTVATVEELSEDLNKLKGFIEPGFGFNEDEGSQRLTSTLQALDIYFAVNRLGSSMVSPNANGPTSPIPKLNRIGSLSSISGESSVSSDESWKICNPGSSIVLDVAKGWPYCLIGVGNGSKWVTLYRLNQVRLGLSKPRKTYHKHLI